MEESKLISVLQQDWALFECYKVHNPKVIWADHSLIVDDNAESVVSYYRNLIQEHAYVIKDTPSFAEIKLDPSDTKAFTAERYGGWGIGKNGGGGRCGNSGKYQLKGIGANFMVGEHDDQIHKYGGLDAPLAIIEIINTYLLTALLPLGAVKIRGLILIGEESAIYHHPANRCWGVIMLRDNCMRPAHFMRAPLFEPRSKYSSRLSCDVARIRRLNKVLLKSFKDPNEFVRYLGTFLASCADQFGFARAARIMHGTLSPSNITMGGQWLDLPLATLLVGGINQSLSSDFYTEHAAPVDYAFELLHGFSKYNGLQLNPAPLANYYAEQFDAHFRMHIGFVLGIEQFVERVGSTKWNAITEAFDAVIHSAVNFTTREISANDNDPFHALIVAFFVSVYSSESAQPFLSQAKISKINGQRIMDHSLEIMDAVWNLHKTENSFRIKNKHHFFVGMALVALKRAYLSAVFFSPLVAENIWNLCQSKTTDAVTPLIDCYRGLIDWIFDTPNEQIILFQSDVMRIAYKLSEGIYSIERSGVHLKCVSCYGELLAYLGAIDRSDFIVENFCFFDFFLKLERIIPLMRSS